MLFRPTRTSPQSKRLQTAAHVAENALNSSRTSAISVPELTGLTSQDIRILDTIIERAAPSATTFLSVFKAYNDVLQEHGLDPHEVVYYGKLLKLGTLRGKNWGEKWKAVKLQHGYGDSSENADDRTARLDTPKMSIPLPSARIPPQRNVYPSMLPRETDSLTLHSHQNNSDIGQSLVDDDTEQYSTQPHRTPWPVTRQPQQGTSSADSCLDSDTRNYTPRVLGRQSRPMPSIPPRGAPTINSGTSDGNADAPSTTPPSYRAAVRDTFHRPASHLLSRHRSKSEYPLSPRVAPSATHQPVAQARKRSGSVVNEDEAWRKIQMDRDEKEADKFREDIIVERCWDLWKRGFQWIHTTNEQVGLARDIHILRLAIQRWREMTASQRALYQRVGAVVDTRRLRAAFSYWKLRLKTKRQSAWRDGMRMKMKTIREKNEAKRRKDAWETWRRSYRLHLSSQHYAARVVHRFLHRWRERLAKLDHMEGAADEFLCDTVSKRAEMCWNHWKVEVELRNAERVISERIDLRVMGDTLRIWRKRQHDNHVADACYDSVLKERTLRSWKAARDRIRSMENRADKHIARQDDVLIRAVTRVWKARERGLLLERVKTVRLVKDVWATWVRRMEFQARLEDLASAFSQRSSAQVALVALQTWRRVLVSHRNAHAFAVQYHSAQLQFKQLLIWRIQLRSKLKMVKQARIGEKYFIIQKFWRVWIRSIEKRRRERALQEFERRFLRRSFEAWLQRCRQEIWRKKAEEVVQKVLISRILRSALTHWTNRVIEIKLRELEVTQRNEVLLLSSAFKKWKAVCTRHVEELRLMESYQYIKREESIRRMFHHWLTAARSSRHRRITLQQGEDEVKRWRLADAWDKWRDKFNNEKLRPIEYDVLIQSQNILLFRSFGVWRSKTKSLPAIRFCASSTRVKFWQRWREAMPRALQVKEARVMDRKITLTSALNKWVQTYRTKIALKAVARARYLRLPAASRPVTSSRPLTTAIKGGFPRRAVGKAESEEMGGPEPGPSRPSKRLPVRGGVDNLLATRPRSEASPPRRNPMVNHGMRDRNQARSEASIELAGEANAKSSGPPHSADEPSASGRSRLWLELRDVKQASRVSTKRSESPSRKPP